MHDAGSLDGSDTFELVGRVDAPATEGMRTAVERADLVAVGLAVQALGRAWGLDDDDDVAGAVAALADAHRMKPEDLVAEAARLHGLLSLPWDDDVAVLADVLAAGAGRVVLDATAHQAYERVVGRILGIWHAGDALAPWLYRGR